MTKGTKFNKILACVDVISVKTETMKRYYTPAACLYFIKKGKRSSGRTQCSCWKFENNPQTMRQTRVRGPTQRFNPSGGGPGGATWDNDDAGPAQSTALQPEEVTGNEPQARNYDRSRKPSGRPGWVGEGFSEGLQVSVRSCRLRGVNCHHSTYSRVQKRRKGKNNGKRNLGATKGHAARPHRNSTLVRSPCSCEHGQKSVATFAARDLQST